MRTGLASFETQAPDEAEVRSRFEVVRGRGFPYLVAEQEGHVAGFAYASPYRTRPAYRFSLEDSVYVHPDFTGRGIGRALLARLIEQCATIGCRQMVAIIGDSGNTASIGLHSALGFSLVGTFRAIGFKHGRWVDSVLMQRAIGQGDGTLPELP
ncbi:MAG TPA: GNAT family N-acetyltransferase [Usitatibacteraceae bacterium]|nr:GNAT family N-acetyltransferase [Usitatibacteraceae bacterium]